jgi:hypothetical protein
MSRNRNYLPEMRQIIMMALGTGLVGACLGVYKNRIQPGFWLGFALGPVGWAITWFFPRLAGRCRGCGKILLQETRVCPKCHFVVDEPNFRVEGD